ncbi:MAG TPA: ribonuclease E/G, partial [Ottowia sp.]|nr:ribonuclease E/G [Ottowia sp.]
SIPCPRCGGSGHVRDTESSALQILRIIQEESMKDNTAAVHVQVPVEVASFLLNEKRPEIAKIELQQRVNVTLVPNKTLETPHYKLERLKHDDPRLDDIDSSYKLAEEFEDPTHVTRRSQEPTNRQQPVIKGVLPDVPAPQPVPKPEPAPVVAAAAPAVAVPTPTPAPQAGGLMGWLKNLFGVAPPPAPVAAPVPAPATASEDRKDGRASRDGERRGGRGGRGGSRGSDSRDGSARRQEGRGNGQGESRNGPRDGSRRTSERGERGERQGPRERRDAVAADAGASTAVSDAATSDHGSAASARPPRGERGDGRRGRHERGDAPPQDSAASAQAAQAAASLPADAAPGTTQDAAPSEERRERRPRGERGGRGDRERRERPVERDGESAAPRAAELPGAMAADGSVTTAVGAPSSDTPAPRSYFARPAEAPVVSDFNPLPTLAQPAPAAIEVAVTETSPAPAEAQAPRHHGMPQVTPFRLPLGDLDALAQAAGLQWVNSDADKVASVQAAIAAEPRPIHVPRQRPPLVVLDEGPLVLVETRQDLRQVHLPFETTAPGASSAASGHA